MSALSNPFERTGPFTPKSGLPGSSLTSASTTTVAALQQAHQLDPDLLAASTLLIERRAFYEDLVSSFTQLQELARKRPRTAWVHEVFSEVLRAAGAPEQAARECEIVRQLDPQFYTGSCVVLYVHMGNFPKARQEINRTPGDFNTMMLGADSSARGKGRGSPTEADYHSRRDAARVDPRLLAGLIDGKMLNNGKTPGTFYPDVDF